MTDKFKEHEKLTKLLDMKRKDLTDTKKRFLQSIDKLDAELTLLQTLSNILDWVPESVVRKATEDTWPKKP